MKIGSPTALVKRSSSAMNRRDRGSAAIVVATVSVALMVAVVMAVGRVGGVLVDRSRAQNAADAAALAAVIGGADQARAIAERHGATVVSVDISDGTATVIVTYEGQRGTARATNRP